MIIITFAIICSCVTASAIENEKTIGFYTTSLSTLNLVLVAGVIMITLCHLFSVQIQRVLNKTANFLHPSNVSKVCEVFFKDYLHI